MKKPTSLPLLFASFLFLGLVFEVSNANAQLKGDSYAEAKAKGSADVMFTFVETPGFAAKEGAEVKGFCVELMNEFSKWLQKEEGITLKPVFYDRDSKDFKQFMEGVKASERGVFGLGNITITDERKATYNFSPPFITNISILLTNKNVTSLQSLDNMENEFRGMTLVTVQGTLNEKRLLEIKEQYFPTVLVKYVPASSDVLDELAANEKAFSNLDFTYYLKALKYRMPVKRHPVGDETSEDFGIIMPKNSDWAPVMARFMKGGFMESTEYRKLIADHLGQHALKLLDAVSVN